MQDHSNELNAYANLFYEPVNPPLVMKKAGNPSIIDFNRWQPLTLDIFIDQSGNEIPFNTPDFLSPEWGVVTPFALEGEDLTIYNRGEDEYWVYHDPGTPANLDTLNVGGLSEEYKWGFALVAIWSSHLDPNNSPLIDISPASIGNISDYPTTIEGLRDFYNFKDGGDPGTGYDLNPSTGLPYETQMVSLADYGRVLAEFWADGPDSETPPGHWFTILNYVNDHSLFEKRYRGEGEILDELEWDVKAYFIMAGAMHDAAVTAWGIKGWYDYIRPVSAIRGMAELGQSSDPSLPSFHPGGIILVPRYIELVREGDPLVGENDEHLNKIKLYAWKGPNFINDPDTDIAGVDWILAENWWPYQRPSFVTPPFAGYISGHSTYSRAAAEVMTMLTGDPFFPGGMGEFEAKKNEFLVFEEGPSKDIVLQWATYRDASDQTSLSRLWGGIHPPVDDMPGRLIGVEIGIDAFEKAETYFFIDADSDGYFYFEDCNDQNPDVNPGMSEICDEIDNDCNGIIDDGIVVYQYFRDQDGDGFGDPEISIDTCSEQAPVGFVTFGTDCDDAEITTNPASQELCDTIDNNCNGFNNEGLPLYVYYIDYDEDGFGDEEVFIITCQESIPFGYVDNDLDCDDQEFYTNPASIELDDGKDNDCNGVIDDNVSAINELAVSGIKIFPNPVDETLSISVKDKSIETYTLIAADGRIVLSGNSIVSNSSETIDVSAFSKGVYFLIMQTSDIGGTWVEKIIKI